MLKCTCVYAGKSPGFPTNRHCQSERPRPGIPETSAPTHPSNSLCNTANLHSYQTYNGYYSYHITISFNCNTKELYVPKLTFFSPLTWILKKLRCLPERKLKTMLDVISYLIAPALSLPDTNVVSTLHSAALRLSIDMH